MLFIKKRKKKSVTHNSSHISFGIWVSESIICYFVFLSFPFPSLPLFTRRKFGCFYASIYHILNFIFNFWVSILAAYTRTYVHTYRHIIYVYTHIPIYTCVSYECMTWQDKSIYAFRKHAFFLFIYQYTELTVVPSSFVVSLKIPDSDQISLKLNAL